MDLEGRDTLVTEARDLLAGMESTLLELETLGHSDERINAIFRAAHTIKGSAGLFGLVNIERFTQRLENVLERVREGHDQVDAALMTVLLRASDYIGKLVDAIEAGLENEEPDAALRDELLAALDQRLTGAVMPAPHKPAEPARETALLHVSLRFDPTTLERGYCPTDFILHLGELGELAYVITLTSALPERARFVPSTLYFAFEVGLVSTATPADVEACFALIRELVTLRTFGASQLSDVHRALAPAHPRQAQRLKEELERLGTPLEDVPVYAPAALGHTAAPAGPFLPDADPATSIAAPRAQAARTVFPSAKQKNADERRAPEQRIVKVDATRLDQLINLVGELVIASEGARNTVSSGKRAEDVFEAMSKVSQLVELIRDRALHMRMTPIGEVFQRFPRVVRDVSRELGKQIALEISGAEAELDKSMVERLADPLTHIVRNAIDHGIEPVDERIRAGKSPEGQLRLHAYHESGCIVVQVSDDGRGLDPERLRAKAVERGLIAVDAVLSESECHDLIFAPGFSTAAQVTNLSGRGVGMDVVKRNVESLRGDVEIDSRLGEGTCFTIRLPLTLAIIDGFQVEVAGTTFVIPLDMVVECVDMRDVSGPQRILNLRDEPLPYLRLRDVFRLDASAAVRESLVVVSYAHQRVGLVVDRLLGNSQAVIKPLGEIFRRLHGVSSSTILGDGSVALILDVPSLISAATASGHKEGPARAGAMTAEARP